MPHNIVFDFGGVIVQYDFKAFFAHQLGSEEQAQWFMQHVLTPAHNNLLDKGLQPFGHYIDQWCTKWPQYAPVIRALDTHYTDIFTSEMPGITALMHSLKNQGHRLLGLSNWSAKVFSVMQKFPEPFSLLDGSLISHEVHLLKPDPAIYRTFCQRFGVSPADCLFIDDKPQNIEGARQAGMQGIVFTSTQQLRRDLNLANPVQSLG